MPCIITVPDSAAELFDSLGKVTLVAWAHLTFVTASNSVDTDTTSEYLFSTAATI